MGDAPVIVPAGREHIRRRVTQPGRVAGAARRVRRLFRLAFGAACV